MSQTDKLRDIWERIPQGNSEHIDFSEKDIINHYMDLFHFGDYFYLIFNTKTAAIEYIDPKIENILGFNATDFNLEMLLNNIHPDDLPYYFHYEQSAVRFFSTLPPELFLNYKFSYDYRLKENNGSYKRILLQVIPIHYFASGGAKTLTIFTDLTHLNITGIPKLSFIGMNGSPSFYNVHLEDEFKINQQLFTKKELEILSYIVKGLKSIEISKQLNRSIFTINNHRKNILQKSDCKNVQELLIKSIREGWV